jgi:hypothetical protein
MHTPHTYEHHTYTRTHSHLLAVPGGTAVLLSAVTSAMRCVVVGAVPLPAASAVWALDLAVTAGWPGIVWLYCGIIAAAVDDLMLCHTADALGTYLHTFPRRTLLERAHLATVCWTVLPPHHRLLRFALASACGVMMVPVRSLTAATSPSKAWSHVRVPTSRRHVASPVASSSSLSSSPSASSPSFARAALAPSPASASHSRHRGPRVGASNSSTGSQRRSESSRSPTAHRDVSMAAHAKMPDWIVGGEKVRVP